MDGVLIEGLTTAEAGKVLGALGVEFPNERFHTEAGMILHDEWCYDPECSDRIQAFIRGVVAGLRLR